MSKKKKYQVRIFFKSNASMVVEAESPEEIAKGIMNPHLDMHKNKYFNECEDWNTYAEWSPEVTDITCPETGVVYYPDNISNNMGVMEFEIYNDSTDEVTSHEVSYE